MANEAKRFLWLILPALFWVTSLSVSAQGGPIQWFRDPDQARNAARTTNRLMVVDLNSMYYMIWSDTLFYGMKDKFVFLGLNVRRDFEAADMFRNLYRDYRSLLIVDYQLNKIMELNLVKDDWRYMDSPYDTDYRNVPPYIFDIFRDLPEDATFLYKHLIRHGDKENVWGSHLNTAFAYALESKFTGNSQIREGFRKVAEKNFKTAQRLIRNDETKKEIVSIYQAIAEVFNKPSRALKDLNKIRKSVHDENLILLKYAYCFTYLEMGEKEKAKPYYDAVINSREEILKQALILKTNPVPEYQYYD